MQEQLSWAMATPQGKAWALLQPGDIAIYHGRFRAAQNLYSVAQSYSPSGAAPSFRLARENCGDPFAQYWMIVYAQNSNLISGSHDFYSEAETRGRESVGLLPGDR